MGEPPPKELLNQSPDKTLNQANAGPEHPEEQPPPGESGRPLEHRPDNIDLGEKRGKRADRSAYNYK
ncbi:MAG: hypothetical protein KDD48_03520 [Bdellovibrionales bacterium]|nr:hypothetical protein [Bdellovibrionales bacterium]